MLVELLKNENMNVWLEVVKIILIIIGGVFTSVKFNKERKFKRLSHTPFIHMEIHYYDKWEIERLCNEYQYFSFKFINKKTLFNTDEEFELYEYDSNEKLLDNVSSCNSIDIVSYNHCAYNTRMTFTEDELDRKELYKINSHYSATIPDDHFFRAGKYFLTRKDFLGLQDINLYVTYQNSYHEKFVDVFRVNQARKYTKIDSYQLFKKFGIIFKVRL